MINNNSTNASLWSTFTRKLKQILKFFLKKTAVTKRIVECIQLSFIYFFAFVVLSYSIQGYLGGFPEFIFHLFPFLQDLLNIPILKILATPEKTFVIYLVVLDLLMRRSRYSFSLLVKFNILLIFVIEMFQNLLISYWDIFLNREIEYSFVGETAIYVQEIATFFFITLYLVSIITYSYCFLRSCLGRFPVFPGSTSFITDSVAFWLQIKITPKGTDKKTN